MSVKSGDGHSVPFSTNGHNQTEGYNCLCSDLAIPVQLSLHLNTDSIYCIYLSVTAAVFIPILSCSV